MVQVQTGTKRKYNHTNRNEKLEFKYFAIERLESIKIQFFHVLDLCRKGFRKIVNSFGAIASNFCPLIRRESSASAEKVTQIFKDQQIHTKHLQYVRTVAYNVYT